MRVLVLGARGAVGRVTVDVLRRRGHDVAPAGRTAPAGGAQIDLSASDGLAMLRRAAETVDVVVNASGVEDARIAAGLGSAALVDISATAPYLRELAAAAPDGVGVMLGAGLVPGLSTIMIAALETRRDDEIDVALMLGSGEKHGPAAVEWTGRLIGSTIHAAPEVEAVPNLHERRRFRDDDGRRRTFLRADFPDHALIGASRGFDVRSYLALSSPVMTGALAIIARMPLLQGILGRAPHIGSAQWRLQVVNRRTEQMLSASGVGQSDATGVLTAVAAERMASENPGTVVTMDRLVRWDEAVARLAAESCAH
jgi:hypothetical protein